MAKTKQTTKKMKKEQDEKRRIEYSNKIVLSSLYGQTLNMSRAQKTYSSLLFHWR